MKFGKDLSLFFKLMIVVSFISLLVVILVGIVVHKVTSETIEETAKENLSVIVSLKSEEILNHYSGIKSDVKVFSGLIDYKPAFESSLKGSIEISDLLKRQIKNFLWSKGEVYERISFVKPKGQAIASFSKSEFEKLDGDQIQGDARNFTNRKRRFSNYEISTVEFIGGRYSSFIAMPVKMKKDTVGFVLFHLNMTQVYDLVNNYDGLGRTGETLIAKKTQFGDALFLNPLRWDKGAALNKIAREGDEKAAPILNAVSGDRGAGIATDYRDKKVIAAWNYIEPLEWGIVGKIDLDEAYRPTNKITQAIALVSLLAIGLAVIISFVYSNYIIRQIRRLQRAVLVLSKGNLLEKEIEKESNDEIGKMIDAANQLRNYQKAVVEFATDIGEGKFEVSDYLKENDGDLTNSLIQMSEDLKAVAREEEKRNWATKGVAKFGDILRKNNDNIKELSYDIIYNLVQYFGAIQGGFYLYHFDQEEPEIELQAAFAFDRRKYTKQAFKVGEGLVSQCVLEGEVIHLTEIPDDYVHIKSGMGDAPPRAVILVPLIIGEETHGVVEMASFNEFNANQIDLLEILAESIASTLSSVKVNIKTKILLDESQEMAEAMRSQEEELRQNQDMMQATHEQMDRRMAKMAEELQKYKEKEKE